MSVLCRHNLLASVAVSEHEIGHLDKIRGKVARLLDGLSLS